MKIFHNEAMGLTPSFETFEGLLRSLDLVSQGTVRSFYSLSVQKWFGGSIIVFQHGLHYFWRGITSLYHYTSNDSSMFLIQIAILIWCCGIPNLACWLRFSEKHSDSINLFFLWRQWGSFIRCLVDWWFSMLSSWSQ